MKEFLAIYLGSASAMEGWKNMNEDLRQRQERAGKEAWQKWAKNNEAAILDIGTPLGKTKRVSAQGISERKNQIGAYTIVQAKSHQDAAKLFEMHPHFMIFPGEAVEIMECLPVPTNV